MTAGEARRARILDELRAAEGPLPGALLAERCGVSRQVVVTDVALLRSQGARVVATSRGYVLADAPASRPVRLFKCHHSAEQTADELTAIVDAGGRVEDVFVNHRVYGKVCSPLMEVTGGYHFHHVSAASEDDLDAVGRALAARGYLVEATPYERATFA